MAPVNVRQETARLRRRFADRVAALDGAAWETPSWCAGWRVRDVLAHLVHNAEATRWSMTRDVAGAAFRPDVVMKKAVTRLSDVPVPVLADRLRAAAEGRGVRIPTFPEAIGLGDVLVHGADSFSPLGLEVDGPADDAAAALDAFVKKGRTIVGAQPHRGRRLVATDLDWSTGTGPVVEGTAMALLLLVTNRRQVIPELTGPGTVGL